MMIYIDLDNTVFDTTRTIVAMYNEDYKYYPNYSPIKESQLVSYDFKELTCASYDEIMKYFQSGRFFSRVKPYPGFTREITDLYRNFHVEIIFVSKGTPANLKGKQEWVDDFERTFLIPCQFIGLDVSKHSDKSFVEMYNGILIDDEPDNLENSDARYKILFGNYDWNQNCTEYDARCINWFEVGEFLRKEVLL